MAKYDLSKYEGKKIRVIMTNQVGYYVWSEQSNEKGESPIEHYDLEGDNIVEGTCVAVTDYSLTVQSERRSRIHKHECFFNQICEIHTSELTKEGKEKAKARSEHMRAVFAARKK